MLESMRRGSKNIFVKMILILLAGSFVLWGVGDVLRGGNNTDIADIDGTKISYLDFVREFESEKARYRQMFSGLSEENMSRLGIKERVISRLIERYSLSKRLNDLNITVGSATAKELLLGAGVFSNENGDFDKQSFDIFLRNNRVQKDDYIDSIRHEAAIGLFMGALEHPDINLDEIVGAVYKYRNEKRQADLLYIPANYIKKSGEPSETDLVQYYQENTERFSVPELRKATYMLFSASDIAKGINVSDDELLAEYEQSKDAYVKAETRSVEQYVFSDEAKAKLALKSLESGEGRQYDDEKISLGEVNQSSLPDDIAKVVFNLDAKNFSTPFKSDLGWHVFYVKNIADGRVLSFLEVKDEIKSYLKEARVSERFEDFSYQIEDEFAAGMTMQDVGKKFDVAVHSLPGVDAKGESSSQTKLTNIPHEQEVLAMIFDATEGVASPMILLKDNATYAVVKVEEISDGRIKALDEVKGVAINFWKENQKKIELGKLAESIAIDIKNGKNINKIAKKNKFKLKKSQYIDRPEDGYFNKEKTEVPGALAVELFSLVSGSSTKSYALSDGGFVIAKLINIKDGEQSEEGQSDLKKSIQQQMSGDIIAQYIAYLGNLYDVEKNQAIIDSIN